MAEIMTETKKPVGPRRKRSTRERAKAPRPSPDVAEDTKLTYPVLPRSLYDLDPSGFLGGMQTAQRDYAHRIVERFSSLELLDRLKPICDDLDVHLHDHSDPASQRNYGSLQWFSGCCSSPAEYLSVCFELLHYVLDVEQAAGARTLKAISQGIAGEANMRKHEAIASAIRYTETVIFNSLRHHGKLFEAIAERLGHPLRKSYTIASHAIRPSAGTVAARRN